MSDGISAAYAEARDAQETRELIQSFYEYLKNPEGKDRVSIPEYIRPGCLRHSSREELDEFVNNLLIGDEKSWAIFVRRLISYRSYIGYQAGMFLDLDIYPFKDSVPVLFSEGVDGLEVSTIPLNTKIDGLIEKNQSRGYEAHLALVPKDSIRIIQIEKNTP